MLAKDMLYGNMGKAYTCSSDIMWTDLTHLDTTCTCIRWFKIRRNLHLLMISVAVFVLLSVVNNDPVVSVIQNKSESNYEALKFTPEHADKDAGYQQVVFAQSITKQTSRRRSNVTCGHGGCDKTEDMETTKTENDWEKIFNWTGMEPFQAQTMTFMCNKRIQIFYEVFVKMTNVTLGYLREIHESKKPKPDIHDPRYVFYLSQIKKVGTLDVRCKDDNISFSIESIFRHMNVLRALSVQKEDSERKFNNGNGHLATITGVSVAVSRDYVPNTYNALVQLYNIFLMHYFFRKPIGEVLVIAVDEKPDHEQPRGELDNMLQVLFGPVINVKNLPPSVRFEQLVFLPTEAFSPFTRFKENSLPFLERFTEFVFSKYAIDGHHNLNCETLNITLIWRRDRPNNYIEQKIFNEADMYQAVMNMYPNDCVRGVLFDVLPMRVQLQIIQHTDILIGMHAEELAHALFLPNTSGLIELIPLRRQVLHVQPQHVHKYKVLSKWKNLYYAAWYNKQAALEMMHDYTSLDVPSVMDTIKAMVQIMCPVRS